MTDSRANSSQPARRGGHQPTGELFRGLVASNPTPHRYHRYLHVSIVVHALAGAFLVFGPILWPEAFPEVDYVRVLVYNPPPPPPPPLPRGNPVRPETEKRPEPTAEVPTTNPDAFVAPVEEVLETPTLPDASLAAVDQFGSDSGHDTGVPEGMEGGVVGGTVGGTLGGVLGGVLGGTGDIPVTNPDEQPRPIRKTKPVYPQDAFVKKIEGIVLVEIYIDTTGRVARARVLQSIPLLDRAALDCVKQWVFTPAIKGGRPVPTIAHAPVTFQIF